MSKRTLNLDTRLYDYLLSVSLRETPEQQALRRQTDTLEMGLMQISAEQGQFMALLIKLIGARKAIEIGTFTGYSALSLALALPEDGTLIACDLSREWTDIAKVYWQQAGVAHKIQLHLAPAAQTLANLQNQGQNESFDFAFIDADKQNQLQYYELCLTLVRQGGLIAVDNVLWGGSVADPNNNSPDTLAIRQFNDFICTDTRIDLSLVPIGDGLTLVRKK